MAKVKSQVLIELKGDSAPWRKELKKAEKAQESMTNSLKKGVKEQDRGIGTITAGWTKIAVGIGAAVGALATFRDGFKQFEKDARLRSAAAGADINRLRQATKGLVDDQQLLTLAAAGLNTEFDLTQEQLEDVATFALTLRKQGNDLDEVMRELTKAIAETNAEGLKKFGVQIKASGGTLEAFNGIVKEARRQNEIFKGSLDIDGDDASRGFVEVDNAVRDLRIELGKLAAEVAPALASIVKAMRGLVGALDDVGDSIFDAALAATGQTALHNANNILRDVPAQIFGTRARIIRGRQASFGEVLAFLQNRNEQVVRGGFGGARRPGGRRGGGPDGTAQFRELDDLFNQDAFEEARKALVAEAIQTILESPDARAGFQAGGFIFDDTGAGRGIGQLPDQAALERQRLISARQSEIFQAGQQGLLMFSQAGTEAFAALIDGSESFADAFEKAIGRILKGQATQMLGTALTEGVLALTSLAIGDLGGAARHGVAAAKAGAAAVALGTLASQFGSSGPPARSGASGGGVSPGAGLRTGVNDSRFGAREARNTQIFIGFDPDDNPRNKADRFQKRAQNSRRFTSEADTVSFG